MHRIVMHVIQSCPKVPVGFYGCLDAIIPYLPSALSVLTIPVERSSPVHQANAFEQLGQLSGQDQGVIVIRQDAPSVKLFSVQLEDLQQAR